MTKPTALTDALVAYTGSNHAERDEQADWALKLEQWGVFSTTHIIQITGLPDTFARNLLSKSSKEGGQFTAEALPFIYDVWLAYAEGGRPTKDVAYVVGIGVSPRVLSRLTTIPESTIKRWVKKEKSS